MVSDDNMEEERGAYSKLVALRMPPLDGKRFLDIGCGEGFYCAYAAFDNAERIVGIDPSASNIARSESLCPGCEFVVGGIEDVPVGPFDVVVVHSLLHSHADQEAFIRKLMRVLDRDGVMVLDITLPKSRKGEWAKLKLSNELLYFPTFTNLEAMLEPCAWKVIGNRNSVYGKRFRNYVVHVNKIKPYVYLMMGNPGTGKSTISRQLFQKADVEVVSGDRVYLRISEGAVKVSQRLFDLVSNDFSAQSIGSTTNMVFGSGLAEEIVGVWIDQSGGGNFALDTYVPGKFRSSVVECFRTAGYYPVVIDAMSKVGFSSSGAERKAREFCFYSSGDNEITELDNILEVEKAPVCQEYGAVWVLDDPVSGATLTEGKISFSGWFLTKKPLKSEPEVYVSTSSGVEFFSFEKYRHGAVESVFREGGVPFPWNSGPCGFAFSVDAEKVREGVEFGIVLEGERVLLANVKVGSGRKKNRLINNFIPKGLRDLFQ